MRDRDVLAACPGAVAVARRPYAYATSAPLEEVDVAFSDGRVESWIQKDVSHSSKPAFVREPQREVETYRRILGPEALGARCLAAGDTWLVIEKVPGVELWQVGDLGVWEAVARWLRRFHDRFAARTDEARAANPHLLRFDAAWYRLWADRARAGLRASEDPRAATLAERLRAYDGVVDALAALPSTLVHGELYPSNVLVVLGAGVDVRVCPVDWEMAGIGPGLLDLAALSAGWPELEQARLIEAYGDVDQDALDRCKLHLALQWIGWSSDWSPPPEHAHDWLGEALALVGRLGS